MAEGERPNNSPGIDRPILVDGTMEGREVERLELSQALGPDRHDPEVYFTTASGNTHAVYQPDKEGNPGRFAIMDLRENEGKGKNATGSYLTDQDVQSGILQRGESFHYGSQGRTTAVEQIIWVQTGKQFFVGTPDEATARSIAQEQTQGNMTNIRSEFWRRIGR